ncbi:MAG TPA: ribonuclease HII [Candidatus Moranbacteria bacterium]|nr:ribonuclease HII [Candidatus Moranbacteria bacterium]
MEKATFNIEKELLEQGYEIVIGVDEAGRGPLAGPVIAAAVTIRNEKSNNQTGAEIPNTTYQIPDTKMWDLVRDSKKLSEKQREKVFDFIHENFHVGVGLCSHETIDRINILEASFLAMKKAVSDLVRNKAKVESLKPKADGRVVILVDGNKQIPNFSMEQKAIVSGDKIVKSISAASIVAKVTRDRMMLEMHQRYPEYGFDRHKGYGTKMHMDALSKHGPCEIHRRSFAPVKAAPKKA